MAVVQPLVRKGGRNRRMDKADALPGTLATRQRQTLTGTAGQKQFTVQGGYSLLGGTALLDVYINGVYITEYTATDGTTFTLVDGLDSASDEVVVVPGVVNAVGTSSGGGGGGATDPNYSQVVSLMHFDGNTTDQKSQTWSLQGNAALTTTDKKFGTGSLALTGGSINTTGTTMAPAGAFTAEMQVKFTTLPDSSKTIVYIARQGQTDYSRSWVLGAQYDVGNVVLYSFLGTGDNYTSVTSATALQANRWYHIALCYDGSKQYLFLDGNLEGSVVMSNMVQSSGALFLGKDPGVAGRELSGFIDEFRQTNGLARYTTSFTPPTAAFPDQ